jgi:hypothetical protein
VATAPDARLPVSVALARQRADVRVQAAGPIGIVLSVEIPASEGHHWLVLSANRIDAQQLT